MNYPLSTAIQRVFAESRPVNLRTYRLAGDARLCSDPIRMVTLIDDHNGERFLTSKNVSSNR